MRDFFENHPVPLLLIKLAALGNLKANFHCAHLHNLSPQGIGDVPTALLGAIFSKTHQSSLTLKGGSTSHLGLLPSGKKRKPPYSVLKPLRYKVGGPSEVYVSSGAAVFCAGMNPLPLKDLLRGCLLVAFFESPPVLPFLIKRAALGNFESELSLRSFAQLSR